jgi:hypothetical protein
LSPAQARVLGDFRHAARASDVGVRFPSKKHPNLGNECRNIGDIGI